MARCAIVPLCDYSKLVASRDSLACLTGCGLVVVVGMVVMLVFALGGERSRVCVPDLTCVMDAALSLCEV